MGAEAMTLNHLLRLAFILAVLAFWQFLSARYVALHWETRPFAFRLAVALAFFFPGMAALWVGQRFNP